MALEFVNNYAPAPKSGYRSLSVDRDLGVGTYVQASTLQDLSIGVAIGNEIA